MSWKIRKLRLALNNTYSENFHLPLRMLKVFKAIVDHFNWQFFFVGNHSAPPLHESVTVSMYPKITLDQLEH